MEFKSNIKIYSDLMLAASIRHDREFRKTHDCHCKLRVDYGNGDWYCESMQRHRNKDPEMKKLKREFFDAQQRFWEERDIQIPQHMLE